MGKDVCGSDHTVAMVEDGLALCLWAEGNGLDISLELLDLIKVSVYVGLESLLAGCDALCKAAKASVLNLEAGGLVVDEPLLFNGGVECTDALLYLGVVSDEGGKRFLIAGLVCGAGLGTKLVLYLHYTAEGGEGVEHVAVLSGFLCYCGEGGGVIGLDLTNAIGNGVVKEAEEGVGIKHCL